MFIMFSIVTESHLTYDSVQALTNSEFKIFTHHSLRTDALRHRIVCWGCRPEGNDWRFDPWPPQTTVIGQEQVVAVDKYINCESWIHRFHHDTLHRFFRRYDICWYQSGWFQFHMVFCAHLAQLITFHQSNSYVFWSIYCWQEGKNKDGTMQPMLRKTHFSEWIFRIHTFEPRGHSLSGLRDFHAFVKFMFSFILFETTWSQMWQIPPDVSVSGNPSQTQSLEHQTQTQ